MIHRILPLLAPWLFLVPALFSLACDDGPSGCINNQLRCEGNELLLCEKSEWVLLADCTQSDGVCQAGQCVNPHDMPDGDTEPTDGDEEESEDTETEDDETEQEDETDG